MKVIIAGSRSIINGWGYREVKTAIHTFQEEVGEITEVVCGLARGPDKFGDAWAKNRGIPVEYFPVTSADWKQYGNFAGIRRNIMMGEYADAAIIVWDGKSRGSKHMWEYSEENNLARIRHRVQLPDS